MKGFGAIYPHTAERSAVGRASRHIPPRLGEKLRTLRTALGLTQEQMLRRLDVPGEIQQTSISQYERGKIEPPISVLLRYAEVANVWLEVLLRDELDLPDEVPAKQKSEGIRRRSNSRAKSK
jgi:transcriptional regulator with XRE-family HTH domain